MKTTKLNWMLLNDPYTEEDGALMPGLAHRWGLATIVAEEQSYEVRPSMPPNHLDDLCTLTLYSGEHAEELGRFATVEEAKDAAELHHGGG